MRYDIAVIGTGPAGVSAAVTAKVRNKSVLLLGSGELTGKLVAGHAILNYPGLPGITGDGLADALRRHLEAMEIAVTEEKISAVYAMGDYFALQGRAEVPYEAAAVIVACGVTADKPLPGEEENLGHGVSYCATCDAPLYRGKKVAVVAWSPAEEQEAAFLAEVCSEVLYFPQYDGPVGLPAEVQVLRRRIVSLGTAETEAAPAPQPGAFSLSLGGPPREMTLTDADGETWRAACVFVLRDAVAPAQLVPGLAADGGHVAVDLQMRTNIPGCFACGDVAGTPYQYVKAAGQGNVAALSAVSYLAAQKTK